MNSALLSVPVLVFLGVVGGCRSAAPSAPAAQPSAEAAPPAAHATKPEAQHEAPSATNRDPHGDPDVGRYVSRLASPDRIAELRVPEVVAKLALAEDSVIGDLGCGPGVFAIPFARAAHEGYVLASDVEPGQLDALRAALEAQDVRNVVPVLSSYGDPHFPPGRLDLVFVGDTYHHLRDRVAYFRRLQRALAPGGRLAILEYKPGKLPVGPAEDHKLPAGVREAELAEAGYALVERFDTHQYHDFEIWRVVQPWEK
ncbi:MAG: class I SAM-dependent methyltransferase [Planctomycetota bacterium]|nr:class I SAM-dependent methyltransferase [Planctomycetota bacterium]